MKKFFFLACITFSTLVSYGQTFKDDYSPWNKKRPVRSTTKLIVLHTTEGADAGSLNIVKKQGTCNYLVTTNGVVHRIISHNRMSKHAGRSMWCGESNISNYSIGIEVVGYHNKQPSAKQVVALKSLIAQLQKMYHLSDKSVVTHSMVAYDKPNEWYPTNHRGRKRCGMLFATSSLRQKLGLSNVFTVDPDVKAKRLTQADPYLKKILYGGSAQVIKEEKPVPHVTESQKENEEEFEGFQKVGVKGVYSIAGEEYDSPTTIYFLCDGRIRTGAELTEKELNNLPKGTEVLVGYVYGGKVFEGRTAYSIVGKEWNFPSTFYRFPDKSIHTGDDVDGNKLPIGTIVLFRK